MTQTASEWFDELADFLRIPSISAQSEHAGDVIRAGNWVCDLIRAAGGEADLADWHGQPLAVGEIRASSGAEQAPTVLCYGHLDVQPALTRLTSGTRRRSNRRSATTTSTRVASPMMTRASCTCC